MSKFNLIATPALQAIITDMDEKDEDKCRRDCDILSDEDSSTTFEKSDWELIGSQESGPLQLTSSKSNAVAGTLSQPTKVSPSHPSKVSLGHPSKVSLGHPSKVSLRQPPKATPSQLPKALPNSQAGTYRYGISPSGTQGSGIFKSRTQGSRFSQGGNQSSSNSQSSQPAGSENISHQE